jgi:hypothetical protein
VTHDEEEKFITWVEVLARENYKAHAQAADELKKECNVLLILLFAGVGAGITYAAKALDPGADHAIGVAALFMSLYLFLLAALTIMACLWIDDFPEPASEPKYLMDRGIDPAMFRVVELNKLQGRIDAGKRRNGLRVVWLNWLRVATLFSPTVPIVCLVLQGRVF